MDFGFSDVLDLASSAMNWYGANDSNISNRQNAQAQMQFQERMDSTKYQRAVNDLNAAGLNPMMAYGNMATNAPNGALGFAAQNALGSAAEAYRASRSTSAENALKKESESVQQATVKSLDATASKTRQDEQTSRAQELTSLEDAKLKASTIRLNSASEAAQLANASKTNEEARFVAAQRAEVEAKQPVWNLIHNATNKAKDVANSNSADNIHRAAENLRSSTRGLPTRNITIYGNPSK